jgi:hypothetical protein
MRAIAPRGTAFDAHRGNRSPFAGPLAPQFLSAELVSPSARPGNTSARSAPHPQAGHARGSGDIISQYTTLPWHSPCAEVAKLKIGPPRGLWSVPNVVNLRGALETTVGSVHSPENEKGPELHQLGAFVHQRGGRDLN